MQASVKIGDTLLTISERQREATDSVHMAVLFDTWTKEVEVVELEDEVQAIEFLQDFLHLDGPAEGGVYRQLVKSATFLP